MAYKRKPRRKKSRKRRKKNSGVTLNPFKRYQTGLTVANLYPYREDGFCACGCNLKLPPRRKRWASNKCQRNALINFWVIKGDAKVIRDELRKRDHFVCAHCGEEDGTFHADHIIEVRHGGGACTLENFQTLCIKCHKIKTKSNYKK